MKMLRCIRGVCDAPMQRCKACAPALARLYRESGPESSSYPHTRVKAPSGAFNAPSSTSCRAGEAAEVSVSPRSPRLELLVESRPGRDSLPFWPDRGARLPTSGVLGEECWRRENARAGEPHRPSCFWLRAGSSYVALQITGKARVTACAIEPVSRGCGQGTSRERRTTRPHPPTTEIASSGGDARSRRADLEPWGSWRGLLPYFPPPGQTERARSHRGSACRTDREHRIMLRATPS